MREEKGPILTPAWEGEGGYTSWGLGLATQSPFGRARGSGGMGLTSRVFLHANETLWFT